MSSASAICDAVVTALASISRVGSGQAVKSGYDILERATSQNCFMVRPERASYSWGHFAGNSGDPFHKELEILAHGFVRLQDSESSWYNEMLSLVEDVTTTFDDNQTLGDIVEWALLRDWEIEETQLDVGGVFWQPIRFHISCMDVT